MFSSADLVNSLMVPSAVDSRKFTMAYHFPDIYMENGTCLYMTPIDRLENNSGIDQT
jgi:hypothetical protein